MNKNYKWLYMAILLTIIILLSFGLKKSKAKESNPSKKSAMPSRELQQTKVDAFVVKPSFLIDEISVSGSLLAYEEVELKNEVAGRVVIINLPEGEFVKKGTLLVKLFDDDPVSYTHLRAHET